MSSDIIKSPTLYENGYAYKHFQRTNGYNSYNNSIINPNSSAEPIKSWDLDPPSHSDLHGEYYRSDLKYYDTVESDNNIITGTENMVDPYEKAMNEPTEHDQDHLGKYDGNYDNLNTVESDAFLKSNTDDYKTYGKFYREDPIMFPPQWEPPQNSDLQETTYQNNYQPYKIDTVKNYRPNEFYVPPREPMDMNTTYNVEYPPRYSQMQRSFKPHEVYTPPLVPMSNLTSYHLEYKDPPWIPRETPFRMKNHETFPKGRFQGETTYITDYPPKLAQSVHCFKPCREYRMPVTPMSTQTSYQTEYTFQPQPKPMSYAPNYVYQQPKVPFHQTTCYSEEFQPHLVSKPESFKPVYEYRKPRIKIEDTTAYCSDYRPWHITKSDPFYPKDNLHLPHVNNEMVTSYMEEFPPRYAHKLRAIKPKENRWRSDEALSNQTTYLTDFRPVTPEPSMSYKPTEIYRSPSLPVVTQSSYSKDFIPRYSKKQDPLLPKSNITVSKLPMDKTSSYSEEFRYRKAKKLENLKPVYRYKRPDVPFSGKTSYQIEFAPPSRVYKINQSCPPCTRYSYMHPTTRMDMTTSYSNDFKPIKNPSKPQPILKEDNLKINYLLNNDLKTSYSIDYVNYFEPYKNESEVTQTSKNVHSETRNSGNILPEINPHNIQLNTTTHHFPQTDANEHKVHNSDSKTTYQHEFSKLPPIQQINQFRPQDYYVPPTVKMSNDTTYSSDYKWPEINSMNNTNLNGLNVDYTGKNADMTSVQLSNRSDEMAKNSNMPSNIYSTNNIPDYNSQNNNKGALGKFMNLMSQNRTDI